jgi:capsular polysaccharide biosynthesis protein
MRSMMPEAVLPANFASDFEPVLPHLDADYRQELPVSVYDHCYITHSGLAVKRLRLLEETGFANVPPRVTRHFRRYARYKLLTEPRLRISRPNLLLIHNHWASGYHHWLTEACVKLKAIEPESYAVMLPASYGHFARDSLRLLGCKDIVDVPAGRGVVASSVTIVANPYSGRFNPLDVAWLRDRLTSICGHPHGSHQRVYLQRAHDRVRKVENEAEVMQALAQYGFTTVDAAVLTFEDQVKLFSGCEVLVGVHGAGLTNCLFMKPGGRVLELYRALAPGGPGMNTCYWNLSVAADLTYYYQFCAHGRHEGADPQDLDRVNVIVDIGKLCQNLELMLRD